MGRGSSVVFMYLGRRGAMVRFTLELARVVAAETELRATFVISSDVERLEEFLALRGVEVRVARLFNKSHGAITQLGRLQDLRTLLHQTVSGAEANVVIDLMPHVWAPLFDSSIRSAGAGRVAILHDWTAHPGDRSGVVGPWLVHSALSADKIVTLSRFVAREVARARPTVVGKLAILFHPDFQAPTVTPVEFAGPLRALFLGRLLAYKGLDLFVEGAELARARGVDLRVGVFGAGDISPLRSRLTALNAEVAEHWLTDAEIDAALARYDVVAATYREASQSGVVATGFGAGRPAIVTPVGALSEQVAHERTGLVTDSSSGEAVSRALARFANDRAFLLACADTIRKGAPARSMKAFLAALGAELGLEI